MTRKTRVENNSLTTNIKRLPLQNLSVLAALLSMVLMATVSGSTVLMDDFVSVNVALCIRNEFVESHPEVETLTQCAIICGKNQRCQAFNTIDSPCQLFVFDKCSKSVRDCSCTRRGEVFMKHKPGLQPGALCPSGYGHDLCGVKYKFYLNLGNFYAHKTKCDSEPGNMVIMADVMNSTEMNHIDSIYPSYISDSFWMGGFQPSGSAEPTGGWIWLACGGAVDPSLWGPDEPGNVGSNGENTLGKHHGYARLADFWESSGTPKGVVCECVSPFD